MRAQSEHSPRTEDLREASDAELLRAIFDLADEASELHRRSEEAVLRLDHVATAIGERWAPEALDQLEREEQAEQELLWLERARRCAS